MGHFLADWLCHVVGHFFVDRLRVGHRLVVRDRSGLGSRGGSRCRGDRYRLDDWSRRGRGHGRGSRSRLLDLLAKSVRNEVLFGDDIVVHLAS